MIINHYTQNIGRGIIFALCLFFLPYSVQSWIGMPTPPLHIHGNKLKDPAGNDVLIHGWMQPTSNWFNGRGRWYSDPNNWTNTENIRPMLEYLNEVATVMTDTTPKYGRNHGWYASFVRMNTDAIGGWDAARGLYDTTQFNGWLRNFIVPYANHLKTRGLYFVLSATGPINTPNNGSRNAGVVEQQRLITFWRTVANFPGIKDADNIQFELMNEPVEIESVPGNGQWGMQSSVYFEAFTRWMQPVIDVIRATGATNVIWVPTLEWQGSPHQWVEFPFTGTNIGVAVHFYPAYGDVRDNATRLQNLWDRSYKPAADRWPMIITEMFWTPYPDDYWNLVNGSTNGFGNNIKRAIDNQGNVSYMVGFIGDLLDEFETRPSQARLLEEREGTPAYFSWLPAYARQSRISFGAKTVPGRVEFEQFESMHGIRVESSSENLAHRSITHINNGAWTRHRINVPQAGNYSISFRIASAENASNQILVKNQAGTTLGTFTVNAERTNGWNDWYVDSIALTLPAGPQDLRLEFTGESVYLYNLDWFAITPRSDPIVALQNNAKITLEQKLQVRRTAEGIILHINAPQRSNLQLIDSRGKIVLQKSVYGQTQIDLGHSTALNPGVYHALLINASRQVVQSLLIKNL